MIPPNGEECCPMDSYLAGFLVGLLCVFAVGTILRLVRRKRGTERAKYDER